MDHLRSLAASPFPGDDGSASAEVRGCLADAQPGADIAVYLRAVAALGGARILVPVVAQQVGDQPGGDKEAEMSVVSLAGPDGVRALLAFTGLDALRAWDARARPVPVTLDLTAQAAIADGASAVLVDVAGPHPLVLEGEVLAELARGRRLVALADQGFGWAMPATAERSTPLGAE